MKRCLITGASGLIGAHLLHLFDDDWEVYCITRQPNQHLIAGAKLFWLPLDLAQPWETDSLPASMDAVIHLAQSEHFRDFPARAENIFQINTLSTVRLLDYARQAGARYFILASTGGVYGYGEQAFAEESRLPIRGETGFYASTKLCAEILADNYHSFMNIITLRFFFVYGPNQRRTMLLPRLVESVIERKPIGLQGSDGLRMNPIHVADAVTAIGQALRLEGSHKINIGGAEVLTLRQIGETIGQVVGIAPLFTMAPEVEPRHLVGSIHKMTQLLNVPKMTLHAGIANYVQLTYPELAQGGAKS